jgi:hypothetical protein
MALRRFNLQPLLVGPPRHNWTAAARNRLLADTQFADDVTVAVRIRLLEVIQKAAALAHQHQQTTARTMILFVGFEVLGQLANTLAEDRDLHFRTAGIGVMGAVTRDNVGFFRRCQHGVCVTPVSCSLHFLSVCIKNNMGANRGQCDVSQVTINESYPTPNPLEDLLSDLEVPPDDAILWRYMDFYKFMYMIEKQRLWFSRVDRLEDPYEGTMASAERANIEKLISASDSSEELFLQAFLGTSSVHGRLFNFVNCWREGKGESMAMWDLYGKGRVAVAIKSTAGLLRAAFSSYLLPVAIRRVKYLNLEIAASQDLNPLSICFRKDDSYRHESEVRLAITDTEQFGRALGESSDNTWHEFEEKLRPPIEVPFNMEQFVTEIVVGPREQSSVLALVESIIKRYGLTVPISSSIRLAKVE